MIFFRILSALISIQIAVVASGTNANAADANDPPTSFGQLTPSTETPDATLPEFTGFSPSVIKTYMGDSAGQRQLYSIFRLASEAPDINHLRNTDGANGIDPVRTTYEECGAIHAACVAASAGANPICPEWHLKGCYNITSTYVDQAVAQAHYDECQLLHQRCMTPSYTPDQYIADFNRTCADIAEIFPPLPVIDPTLLSTCVSINKQCQSATDITQCAQTYNAICNELSRFLPPIPSPT